MTLLDRLTRLELLVITGKGGVGKSVVTAALGRVLVKTGKRVLLLETDPRENLYQLLGVPPSGNDVVEAEPGLWLQNLSPVDVLGEVVREHLRIEVLVRRVLASPVYRHFVEGAPGFKEMAVLGHALRVLRGIGSAPKPDVDVVLLDAPATGHGIALLLAPLLTAEVIPHGPIGHMAGDIAEFVRDAERCGVLVTTLAEEMPVQETLELRRSLAEGLSREPELLVVNGLYPEAGPDAPELPGDADRLWRERRRVNDRELARLAGSWPGARVELPLLPVDRGPDLVAGLAGVLEGALTRRVEAPCT